MGASFLNIHSQSSVIHKESRKSCWRLLCSVPSRLPQRPKLRLIPLSCMVDTTVMDWATMEDIMDMVSLIMPMPVFPTVTAGLMVPTMDLDLSMLLENVRLKLMLRLIPLSCTVDTTDWDTTEDTEATMVSPIMLMPVFPTAMDGLMVPTMDLDLSMENRYF